MSTVGSANGDTWRALIKSLTKPFEPSDPPLYRAVLVRQDPRPPVLGIAVDHLLFDGRSVQVFAADLASVYREICAGVSPRDLHQAQSDYRGYVEAQAVWLQSPERRKAEQYWLPLWEQHGRFPRLPLPLCNSPVSGPVNTVWACRLDAQAVKRTALSHRLTDFMLMAAALCWHLHRLTGEAELGLLYSYANRMYKGAADAIGYFDNRMLMSVRVPAGGDFADVALATRNAVLSGLEHGSLPFAVIGDRLFADTADRSPDNPYLFLSVETQMAPLQFGAAPARVITLADEDSFASYPGLSISYGLQATGEAELDCAYSRANYADAIVERLMAGVASTVCGGAAGP